VPRSYSDVEILGQYLDLQASRPGAVPSVRALTSSLAITPSALYRYFPSISAIEIASTSQLYERLALHTFDLPNEPGIRLSAIAEQLPGLLWAATRIDSDRPPPTDTDLAAILGLSATADVLQATFSTVGVLWRLHRDRLIWRREIQRVVPTAWRLFETASRNAYINTDPPSEHPPVRLADVLMTQRPTGPATPVIQAVLTTLDQTNSRPSLREIAAMCGVPRAGMPEAATTEALCGAVRSDVFHRLAANPAGLDTPLDVITNWFPAVELCFDRPALVDVLVRGPVGDNPHRTHQRKVWEHAGAAAPTPLTFDDLTDVLAGFIMYTARRNALERTDVRRFVIGFAQAVTDSPSCTDDDPVNELEHSPSVDPLQPTPPRDSPRPTSGSMRPDQPQGTELRLLEAALAIIARDGFSSLTLRALATHAQYSPGAVAYHCTPIERFTSRVWVELHQRTANALLLEHGTTSTWAIDIATAWLDWAAAHPLSASFYFRYIPHPDHVQLGPEQLGLPDDDPRRSARMATWWYCVRRSQAATELAHARRDEPSAADDLAAEIEAIATIWVRQLQTAPG
jgi:AcrR family transcriptional regulator